MTRALLALLLAASLIACAPESEKQDGGFQVPEVGPAKVDVDTPALRKLKADAGIADCAPGSGAPVEGGLPDIEVACLGGGPSVDLSTLRGPMVVSFWADWCAPCRDEMPVLQKFHEKYAGRVQMLGIDYKDIQPRNALELARDSKVTYPLLADPGGDLDRQGPLPSLRGLPFLALVDESGKVVHREFVVIETLDQLADLVEEHLGVTL